MSLGIHCLFAEKANRVEDPGSSGKVKHMVAAGRSGGSNSSLGVAEHGKCSLNNPRHHCEHVWHKPSTLAWNGWRKKLWLLPFLYLPFLLASNLDIIILFIIYKQLNQQQYYYYFQSSLLLLYSSSFMIYFL